MSKNLFSVALLTAFLFSSGCQLLNHSKGTSASTPPPIQREFRAAWVATVANINWPSAPGIPVEQQKEEALKLLNLLKDTNFNAVIFQVRPQADALYESTLEPWSYYLTGQQGVAPDPYYDPLEFWINEAHKRNLELHVWLNPYRAHHIRGGLVSEHSIVNTRNELVVPLKGGYWWFDPSLKETQDHSHAVVMDILKRYDIDGVHFDDYFYPYSSYNWGDDFPDEESWAAYQASGGKMSKADWRRDAVNTFIERVYTSIKKEKPYVKFGISPFGVWRPGNPPSIQGFDQYNELYADAKKWLNEGWVDYFSPQLYWPTNQIPQSFPVLLDWWEEQNTLNRHLWPGMSIGRFEGDKQIDEVINQIMITRGIVSDAPGTIHWSIQPLVASDSLQQELVRLPYAQKALIPSMNWIRHKTPKKPDVNHMSSGQGLKIILSNPPENMANWIVYARYGNHWESIFVSKLDSKIIIPFYRKNPPAADSKLDFGKISVLEEFQVTYINRLGFESDPYLPSFGYSQ